MINPWLILAVILAIAGAGTGGYIKGRVDADRSAQIETLEATIKKQREAAEASARISRKVDEAMARAVERAQELEKRASSLDATITELEKEDALPPPAPVIEIREVPIPSDCPPVVAPRCPAADVLDRRFLDQLRRSFPPGPVRSTAPSRRPS
jgi:hypothetical protein